MEGTVIERVLEQIKSLSEDELRSVEEAVQNRLAANLGYSWEDWNAMQSLVAAGLLQSIPPHCTASVVDPPPAPIKGRPLSEIIVEERR